MQAECTHLYIKQRTNIVRSLRRLRVVVFHRVGGNIYSITRSNSGVPAVGDRRRGGRAWPYTSGYSNLYTGRHLRMSACDRREKRKYSSCPGSHAHHHGTTLYYSTVGTGYPTSLKKRPV